MNQTWDCLGFMCDLAVRALDEKHHQQYEIVSKTNVMMLKRFPRRSGNELKRSYTADGVAKAAKSH